MATTSPSVSTPADLLLGLTPSQLQTLRVLHQSGWLYKEAAFRLGVPESTVRTTVHRALVRARARDRSELAYALGAFDEQVSLRERAVRARGNRDTLAGTCVEQAGALGRVGRSRETA
jgi:Sigma-70, region 4